MGIRKRVTEKQLQANRQNSLKSTGPKTLSGKRQSSINSWKHGILSAQVIVPAGSCQEETELFVTLLTELRKELQPHGTLEDLLVQQIAIAHWRLGRVHRFEAGEITKNTEKADRVQEELWLRSSDPNLLRRNPEGMSHVWLLLEVSKLELKTKGFVTDKVLDDLSIALEPYVGSSVRALLMATNNVLKSYKDKGDQDLSSEFDQMMLLLEECCRPAVQILRMTSEARVKVSTDGVRLRASLPDADAIDLILRYETSVRRSLDGAMMQLERLQLARKGKAVPPPARMSLRG